MKGASTASTRMKNAFTNVTTVLLCNHEKRRHRPASDTSTPQCYNKPLQDLGNCHELSFPFSLRTELILCHFICHMYLIPSCMVMNIFQWLNIGTYFIKFLKMSVSSSLSAGHPQPSMKGASTASTRMKNAFTNVTAILLCNHEKRRHRPASVTSTPQCYNTPLLDLGNCHEFSLPFSLRTELILCHFKCHMVSRMISCHETNGMEKQKNIE